MAKALDYDENEELIFQMQLDEIRKISDQTEETGVLSDLFPRFYQTDGGVGKINYPLTFDGKTAFTDISSEQSNSEEDLGDVYDTISNLKCPSREMNGCNFINSDKPFRDIPRIKPMIPIQYQTKNPHDLLRRDSMRQQLNLTSDNDPDDRIRNVDEDLIPRENLFGVKLNSNDDYKSSGGTLILEPVRFEMDNQIITEKDIEEQDQILAQQIQLESDLESAKRLYKHINRRGKSRKDGLLMQGNVVNISQKNVNLPQCSFEMQREPYLFHRHQQHPDQVQSQQLRTILRATTDRVRPNSVQYLNHLRATEFTTQYRTTRKELPQPSSSLAHITIPALETQRRPLGLQHQLLRHNGSRLLRRASSDFQDDDIDVDGLDYEEILALEEQIGEVKSLGLQQSDIETLPKETITNLSQLKKKQCCICLGDFQLKDIVRKLPCLHIYHKDCIDCWLKRKAECPVCKKNVTSDTSKNV